MRLALAKCNLSYVEEIVLMAPEEFAKKIGIDYSVCQEFHEQLRMAILPRPLENIYSKSIATGLPELDDLGGIAVGQLFEVFGEAGCILIFNSSWKNQFCTILCNVCRTFEGIWREWRGRSLYLNGSRISNK
jgi:hypothetical protein